MFRKLFGSFGRGAAAPPAGGGPAPYGRSDVDQFYDLLFCDDPSAFAPRPGHPPTPWQAALFGGDDPGAVRQLADDPGEESRIRLLACDWLRARRQGVPPRVLLGVVVEVSLERGLDVLAAYADGRVRYINQTGRVAVFEVGPPPIVAKAREVVASAEPAIEQLALSTAPRRPPPTNGAVRITLLASDGRYLGEGPFEQVEREPTAAPIIRHASELLQLVVRTTVG